MTDREPIEVQQTIDRLAHDERAPTAGEQTMASSAHAPQTRRPNHSQQPMSCAADDERAPIGGETTSTKPAHAHNSSRRPNAQTKPEQQSADDERAPVAKVKPNLEPAHAHPLPDRRFSDPLIATIVELWRRRQSWHRAEKSLTLAASAICRRYVGVQGKADKAGLKKASDMLKRCEAGIESSAAGIATAPLLAARAVIRPKREEVEAALEGLAKKLPIAHVVEQTYGLGFGGLASIIGEAGDLTAYVTVQGIWKRLGLAVIRGERQRRKTDPVEAKEHGYSAVRRSAMWNVGCGLIGAMGHGPRPKLGEDVSYRNDLSPWQKMFIKRLRYEVDRDEAHRRPNTTKEGVTFESFSSHAANRARRYVEKQFLKQLWLEWHRVATQATGRPTTEEMPREYPAAPLNSEPTAIEQSKPPSAPRGRPTPHQKATAKEAAPNLSLRPRRRTKTIIAQVAALGRPITEAKAVDRPAAPNNSRPIQDEK